MNRRFLPLLVIALLLSMAGCNPRERGGVPGPALIAIDGSSTVFPITEAVAEEYQKGHAARVTIGVSGSGGGFKKLCRGEIDINNASRPIKSVEMESCRKGGVEYIELPVAFDGIAVVVNRGAEWIDFMTLSELRKVWEPAAQGRLMRWSDIREGWPREEMHLFGPGVDSGTYDYFTEAVVGEEHSSRGDFTSSEDDNVLVQGVISDPFSLGFFGFAYYYENRNRLKVVPVDDGNEENGAGPITPSFETISNRTYQPLSRPLFIYVNSESARRKEVMDLVSFFLRDGPPLVKEVGYIPLPDEVYRLAERRFQKGVTGSIFGGEGSRVGVNLKELLTGE